MKKRFLKFRNATKTVLIAFLLMAGGNGKML